MNSAADIRRPVILGGCRAAVSGVLKMDIPKPPAPPANKAALIQALQEEFYSFDFTPLMREGEQKGSFMQFVPVINAVMLLVVLIRVFTL